MSALSYCPNWGGFQHLETELPQELIPFPYPGTTTNFDYLFETNDLFYSESCNSLLYDFSDNLNCLTPEPLVFQQEYDPICFPKRHKPCEYQEINTDNHYFDPVFLNGLQPQPAPNQGVMFQDFSPPETAVPCFPDFPVGNYGAGSFEKKETTAAGGLSAQSVAARQRRRKITEKTQELGKLVPGGQKMNTAEMLQAAYKYIKYLQAQVGILGFMDSYQQGKREPTESEDDIFQGLLESPLIQEKLYSSEKCMVPEEFVQELTNDDHIVKSNPHLSSIVKQER